MGKAFNPYPYQQYCIDRIISDPYLGLFLDMGLGKTVITLTALHEMKYLRWQMRKALVIAPKKVAEKTWSNEAEKWDHLKRLRVSVALGSAQERIAALEAPADVYVINRENVGWLVGWFEKHKQPWPFDLLMLNFVFFRSARISAFSLSL